MTKRHDYDDIPRDGLWVVKRAISRSQGANGGVMSDAMAMQNGSKVECSFGVLRLFQHGRAFLHPAFAGPDSLCGRGKVQAGGVADEPAEQKCDRAAGTRRFSA
jgi:hypothetical protein